MKVSRNHTRAYRRKLILRRTGIIGGAAALVLVLGLVIFLAARPIANLPVAPSSSESPATEPSSPDYAEASSEDASTVSSGDASSEGSSSDASSQASSTSSISESSQSDWAPSSTPDDAPAYTKSYPDLYCPPPEHSYDKDNVIFLTFDDGPSPTTDRILDVLKENNIKATFFVTAQNPSNENMNRMKRIVEEGHTIAIHTYSHEYHQIYASVQAYLDDFYKMYQKIYEVTGVKASIFRFPGGSNTGYNKAIREDVVEEMTRRGFTFYDWNIDSSDASGNNVAASKLVSHTLSTSEGFNHGIVLMHDLGTKKTTADALPEIIAGLKQQGYTFDKLTHELPSVNFLPKNKS